MDTKNKLILFDVNGLLALKVTATDKIPEAKKCNVNYSTVARHGVYDMLTVLSEKYVLGIYSSTTYPNISIMLQSIFRNSELCSSKWNSIFTIISDRNNTCLDPEYGINKEIKSYDTIKDLKRIWEHPIFNKDRKWNDTNTLLIDHDKNKLRFNNKKNILVVDEYLISDYKSKLDNTSELIKAIEEKMALF